MADESDQLAAATGAQGFRARIEQVSFGGSFLLVDGWAVDAAGAPLRDLALNIDGIDHPITGLFARADLQHEGTADGACAFSVDIARSRVGDRIQTIAVSTNGQVIASVRLSDLRHHSFRPKGSFDQATFDMLSGWVFDPMLWHDLVREKAAAVTLGKYRLPLKFDMRRHELPFSAAKGGRALGFQIPLLDALRDAYGAGAVEEVLAMRDPQVTLLSGDEPLDSAELEMAKNAPAAPVAAPSVPGALTPGGPDGFIDFYGYSDSLEGWLFGGWLTNAAAQRPGGAATVVIDQALPGTASLLTYARPDVSEFGVGLLGFVEGSDSASTTFDQVLLPGRPSRMLQSSGSHCRLDELPAIEAMRAIIRNAPEGKNSPLAERLSRAVYQGIDTVNRLSGTVHLEIDELIVAPGVGAMLIGWFVDPTASVKEIRVRSPGQPPAPLTGRWLTVSRPDIREAFSSSLGVEEDSWGFHAFASLPKLDPGKAYVELELHDGSTAFKPLPRPTRAGKAGIIRALSEVRLTSDTVQMGCGEVLGPTALAISRERLAKRDAATEMIAGTPPDQPRCSVIVPLHTRLDFMMYQMALFSEQDDGTTEYIYVLDEPARREEFVQLARSVYRRFGVPMRLVLPAANLGFAGANNVGLEAARGEYICYLNSDVLPQSVGWSETLIRAIEADPLIGILSAQLLFEDGSVQHAGMKMERKEQFGGLLFPWHPGKGRVPSARESIRRVPLVTGALMMMRRDLAIACGGFDTDYVIGDFEDADLCMQVRKRGLHCAVHDGVRLFHLERQSQVTAANLWRLNLTLVNAWTFYTRWGTYFGEESAPADGLTQIG